jgi:hypothetical protein
MDKTTLLAVFISLSFASHLVAADADKAPQELKDLQAKHESDVQSAIKSIQNDYLDDLKNLLQSEIGKGDDDAAAAVQAEITKMEAENTFTGTKWKTEGGSVIEFESQGKWTEDWEGIHYEGFWMVGKKDAEVTVFRSDNLTFHYTLTNDKNLLRDYGQELYHQINP